MGNNNISEQTLLGLVSKKISDTVRVQILGVILIFPILVMLCTVMYSYESIQINREIFNQYVDFMVQGKVDLFNTLILEHYKAAKIRINCIKNNIAADLSSYYGDNISQMKIDFTTQTSQSKFFQIISHNILNEYNSADLNNIKVFAATKDGILIDNSYKYYSSSFTSWKEIKNTHHEYSKYITDNIYTSIYHQDNEMMLVTPTGADVIGSDNVYTYIEGLVRKNDLESLMNSHLICVSYIFNSKDVFGVDDMVAGSRTNNDKIYIIQVFNIKTMIDDKAHYIDQLIDKYDTNIRRQMESIDRTYHLRLTMVCIIFILEAAIFAALWYLYEFFILKVKNHDIFCKLCYQRSKEGNQIEPGAEEYKPPTT